MDFDFFSSGKDEAKKAEARSAGLPFPPRKLPAFCLAFFLGLVIGTASGCSGVALAPSTPAENGSKPAGGAAPSISMPAESAASPTATVEAAGVYPPPGSSNGEPGIQPKAVTPPEGGNSIFLPVVANGETPLYPFELQTSGIKWIQGFYGCNWSGVAGILFDMNGVPVDNLVLHLEGTWGGSPVNREVLSGTASQYSPTGAYEFVLGTQTLDSAQTLWIQIRDGTGKEISARISFGTYNDCQRNLVWISFNQVR